MLWSQQDILSSLFHSVEKSQLYLCFSVVPLSGWIFLTLHKSSFCVHFFDDVNSRKIIESTITLFPITYNLVHVLLYLVLNPFI